MSTSTISDLLRSQVNPQVKNPIYGDGDKPAPAAGKFFETALKNMIEISGCISGKFSSDQFCKK